jgi:hypothetical protein
VVLEVGDLTLDPDPAEGILEEGLEFGGQFTNAVDTRRS